LKALIIAAGRGIRQKENGDSKPLIPLLGLSLIERIIVTAKKSGIKGLMLSSAAGIISMGPVYAWYPLLKELREKGAAHSLTAIFINSRAIKPFLLPVMISYFGLGYAIVLTLITMTGTIVAGYITGAITRD